MEINLESGIKKPHDNTLNLLPIELAIPIFIENLDQLLDFLVGGLSFASPSGEHGVDQLLDLVNVEGARAVSIVALEYLVHCCLDCLP